MSLRVSTTLLLLVSCKGTLDVPNSLCDPKDDPVQCGSLCDLYFNTEQTLEGWVDGTSLCGWPGVTCSGTQVTALDLSNKSLRGDIPASIGNLTFLERLVVSNNIQVETGQSDFGSRHGIPEEICKLSKLQRLDLSYNAFVGSVPACIGTMSSLNFLILNHNNPLGGSIPDMFDQLTNLQVLDMSHTQTTGSIPPSLLALPALRSLDLSHCMLGGSIADFGQLVSLEKLSLTGNNFGSWTSHSICDLIYQHDLTDCEIYANPLDCPIPACASRCSASCMGSTVTV